MDAYERLRAARQAAIDGKYESALAEFEWFHHNALAEEPALSGVRLSFALAFWMELAEVYPPARVALEAIVIDKTQRLAAGVQDRQLFRDVNAINEYLDQPAATAELFETLDKNRPDFAKAYANDALEALAKAGKFHLAAKYLPDPIQWISELARMTNHEIARISERPRSKSPRYGAFVWIVAKDLRILINIFRGIEQIAVAEECEAAAFTVLKPWYVRNAVARALAEDS